MKKTLSKSASSALKKNIFYLFNIMKNTFERESYDIEILALNATGLKLFLIKNKETISKINSKVNFKIISNRISEFLKNKHSKQYIIKELIEEYYEILKSEILIIEKNELKPSKKTFSKKKKKKGHISRSVWTVKK